MNNSAGRMLEMMIEGAAKQYQARGQMILVKMPEPFRVIRNTDRGHGRAQVQFTARAQPDFIGCLAGGRMVVFEAKHTAQAQIKQDAVTPTQARALDAYAQMGAWAGICCQLSGGGEVTSYMVPWQVWKNMKMIFGKKSAGREELRPFKVRTGMVVYFADGIEGEQI